MRKRAERMGKNNNKSCRPLGKAVLLPCQPSSRRAMWREFFEGQSHLHYVSPFSRILEMVKDVAGK